MQRAAALRLLSVVVLGACGGDDAAGSDTGPRIVDASEFEFGDEVLEVAAGSDVIVELHNKGSLEHNWTLLDAGVAATTASDILPGDVIASVNADPARSESVTFVAPAPGTYRVVCVVPGHLEGGMETSLGSR